MHIGPGIKYLQSMSLLYPVPLYCFLGNKVYGNRRTLEDAIQLGKCLYSISGDNSYPMHDFYRYCVSTLYTHLIKSTVYLFKGS